MTITRDGFEIIGVGSPIMDLLAPVTDAFLHQHVAGEKGGMMLVDHAEMQRIVSLLPAKPAYATGGSAANATFTAARLGLRATFLGKLGNDETARVYRHAYETAGA